MWDEELTKGLDKVRVEPREPRRGWRVNCEGWWVCECARALTVHTHANRAIYEYISLYVLGGQV